MLNFLKDLNNNVKLHNKVFSVLLVFHGKRFNHNSFGFLKAILDYIKENPDTFKTLTLSEYVNMLNLLVL